MFPTISRFLCHKMTMFNFPISKKVHAKITMQNGNISYTYNSQKWVKNQKSTNKHLSFDGLIQEYIDLSDIYLAVPLNKYVNRS